MNWEFGGDGMKLESKVSWEEGGMWATQPPANNLRTYRRPSSMWRPCAGSCQEPGVLQVPMDLPGCCRAHKTSAGQRDGAGCRAGVSAWPALGSITTAAQCPLKRLLHHHLPFKPPVCTTLAPLPTTERTQNLYLPSDHSDLFFLWQSRVSHTPAAHSHTARGHHRAKPREHLQKWWIRWVLEHPSTEMPRRAWFAQPDDFYLV